MSELILPPGVERGTDASALIDNRTDLPNEVVEEAARTYFVETASLGGIQLATYQNQSRTGSLLARTKFHEPGTVQEEIELARDLAEKDDDIGAAIGQLLAVAFSEGMENFHEDDEAAGLFNGIARNGNFDHVFRELYREWLIAYQATTVSLFQRRTRIDVRSPEKVKRPPGTEPKPAPPRQLPAGRQERAAREQRTVVAPLIGVLPSELIHPIGSDLFGNADLAFRPPEPLATHLREFFDPDTSPARKAELGRMDPVSAALFTGPVKIDLDDTLIPGGDDGWYRLNPRMAHRSTGPKGDQPHPTPLLTRNLPLLEAKRLLNLMDYALLQGGMSFIVVAKKGSDQIPAKGAEITNLERTVRQAARSGVIVGDHRLSFEIITPDLGELLSSGKRRLVARKLTRALLRLPEWTDDESAADQDLELMTRVVSDDRQVLRRHVENNVYPEVVARNASLTDGPAKIWFPKIVLNGLQFFTDLVLKLRDRGDIPRKFAVEAAGFDWEAGVQQRRRELEQGVDEVMTPGDVPFHDAGNPQDNNDGRPEGTSSNNGTGKDRQGQGRDPAAPNRKLRAVPGETVRAYQETAAIVRAGEKTYEVLEQYHGESTAGRLTRPERTALDRALREHAVVTESATTVVPLNAGHRVRDGLKGVRLGKSGLTLVCGERVTDGAIVAKALIGRSPHEPVDLEELALRWGLPVDLADRS